jgi:signal transduction histidine kinase/ActR/RegA family two-component response regulator
MRGRSIRARLVALSVAVTATALASATGIILLHERSEARRALLDHLESTAAVIGANCTAALTFGDIAAAREVLESAATVPGTAQAVLYRRDGSVFAEYRAAAAPMDAAPVEPRPGRALHRGRAEVVTRVSLDGELLGLVYLRAATDEIDARAMRHALVALCAACGALAVAWLLLTRFISAATKPVLDLSALTQEVSHRGDYALRARVEGHDELAMLARGFNRMLAAVEQRDRALEAQRRSLAEEVAARTADLAATMEQLGHAQRMEAVGRLAGGVAHDFNNILSVILTFAGSLSEELPEGELRSFAQEIERAGQRATALTRQLLAFSRKQVVRPEVLAVEEVVRSLVKMMARLIGEHIELAVRIAPGSGCVYMDPSQLEQVLVNLAVNARDAMPDGGQLAIDVGDVEVAPGGAHDHARVPPGSYVRIRISDTGTGMDAATLARIFEPFFTTKPKGKGTGLGLAMVYGAVKQSGGAVDVASEPGAGTTFTIHLPRVARPVREAKPSQGDEPEAKGHGERVLVVEDEPQLRDTIRRFLSAGGYEVVEASNGEEGLAAFDAERERIRLVLTDLVMPGTGGIALGRTIHAQSDVPILYMSGYSEDVASGKERIAPELFMQKPFDRRTLLERVGATIAAAPDARAGSPRRSPGA